jgi:hypothetical protein
MQRRLLVIVLVFVACFGVGYGITWIFVGSPDRGASRPATAPAPAATPAPVATTAPVDVTNATADVAQAPPDTTPAPAADAAVAAAPDAGPAGDATPTVVADTVAPAPTPAPAEWEACLGKVCRLDFGKVSGGISIREGRLEHGKPVAWEKDFARSDKVGTIDAGKNVRVEVVALGLSESDPTKVVAAQIIRKLKRTEQKGVISLRIGDKMLRLVPIEE